MVCMRFLSLQEANGLLVNCPLFSSAVHRRKGALMGSEKTLAERFAAFGIAALCFGYFASYIPYSMMTKMIADGLFAGMNGTKFSGFEIQPVVVLGSLTGMYSFITFAGWWKFATHSKVFGVSIPRPQWFTFISGLCTACQIVTTTLAYTFSGVSIVFVMLLMRGGVLIMAPMVDLIVKRRKRKIYWPSWVASALSMAALLVTFSGKSGTAMTIVAAIDIGLYLFGYFFRLFFMSGRAKSDDVEERKRYFTEEQLVANITLFATLFMVGLAGSAMAPDSIPRQIWAGFTEFPFKGYILHAFMIGIFSYGTGLFGSLIFLDKRENTFTVPANRASSILAGVIASYLLAIVYGQKYPSEDQLIGAALIIGAIMFLMYRSMMDKRKKDVLRRQSANCSCGTAAAEAK